MLLLAKDGDWAVSVQCRPPSVVRYTRTGFWPPAAPSLHSSQPWLGSMKLSSLTYPTFLTGADSVHVRPPSAVVKTTVVLTEVGLSRVEAVTARYARPALTASRTSLALDVDSIAAAACGVTSAQLRAPSVVRASSVGVPAETVDGFPAKYSAHPVLGVLICSACSQSASPPADPDVEAAAEAEVAPLELPALAQPAASSTAAHERAVHVRHADIVAS